MNIRLTDHDTRQIIAAIETFIFDPAQLYLHGSRTDLSKKGGDIDLLLVVDNSGAQKKLLEIKHEITAYIKKEIGDQKVDLIIASRDELANDPFLKIIFQKAVLLKRFMR